jgi:hypothetical protein
MGSLQAIHVDPANPSFCSVNGVLLDKNKTQVIRCPQAYSGSFTVPEGVTSLKDNDAFYDCWNLTSVNLPNSLTDLRSYTFYSCTALKSITIPEGVTRIYSHVFYNCTSLTSVTIPDGVTQISSCAFYNCTSLTSVTLPASVTTINMDAFGNCPSLTIYGYAGSYAQTYANNANIPFVVIEP